MLSHALIGIVTSKTLANSYAPAYWEKKKKGLFTTNRVHTSLRIVFIYYHRPSIERYIEYRLAQICVMIIRVSIWVCIDDFLMTNVQKCPVWCYILSDAPSSLKNGKRGAQKYFIHVMSNTGTQGLPLPGCWDVFSIKRWPSSSDLPHSTAFF